MEELKLVNINEVVNEASAENKFKFDCEINFVHLPYLPLHTTNTSKVQYKKQRWELIEQSLNEKINSSVGLEAVIKQYNKRIPNFLALHNFINEILNETERNHFFTYTLPGIIKLALQLPKLILNDIPLLKQRSSKSANFSQLQVASLLANAFLCTFPSKSDLCPDINFARLFSAFSRPKREKCVSEKLKTICHYFNRVIAKEPLGLITFKRQYFSDEELPIWETVNINIGDKKVEVRSEGLIEDDSEGFLQVDFANRNVGGGVLAYGCVQEEIRFIICPELIAYSGFYTQGEEHVLGVATGNWGCGAYRGDPRLKFLIQLMACGITKHDMIYFTFNDHNLTKNLDEMYTFIISNNITIAELYQYLSWFSLTRLKHDLLYKFIYYIHFNKDKYTTEDLCKFTVKNFTRESCMKRVKNLCISEQNEEHIDNLSTFFTLE
ncbi:hypothetical protein FQA39_LY02394 [Lamprigera yunnana]|nr:hypothetical protein FQA39_LY02394 [Lamprigera yunnana]